MSSDSMTQFNILECQLDHDRKMRAIERLHDLMVQGAKGLTVLNGGAAVAVLAFIQALVEKPLYVVFKPYAVNALLLFLIGAFLSGSAFFFHYKYVIYSLDEGNRQKFWRWLYWGILGASALSAFAGGAFIVVGVCKTV